MRTVWTGWGWSVRQNEYFVRNYGHLIFVHYISWGNYNTSFVERQEWIVIFDAGNKTGSEQMGFGLISCVAFCKKTPQSAGLLQAAPLSCPPCPYVLQQNIHFV